jgi:putative component of membrane protein insertase Oxa1/YidC/SpoIIIJ protein YidD
MVATTTIDPRYGVAGDFSAAGLVAGAISLYQRYVSPYKGFRCAHRALHGRASCSEFAKRVTIRRGVLALPALLRRRFDACADAARRLARRRRKPHLAFARRKSSSQSSWEWGECGSAIAEGCAEGGIEACGHAAGEAACEAACSGW